MSREKYRTSLKSTIARGVLSKCRGYDKTASRGSGETRRVEGCSELCCVLCKEWFELETIAVARAFLFEHRKKPKPRDG